MWCEKCQAHVAAEASWDNQRLSCTSCGTEFKGAPPSSDSASPGVPPHRDPRELLARWAKEDATDPFGPLVGQPRDSTPQKAGTGEKPFAAEQPVLRFDRAHPSVLQGGTPAESHGSRVEASPGPALNPQSFLPAGYIWHPPQAIQPPHFQTQPAAPAVKVEKTAGWVALTAQILSYVGVGTLTIGAVLVLMGYFGGPPNYAPMGWLVTTAGQMLLFLGVVTLISCGMEQTTTEVARRIESLGAKLVRVEQTTAWTASRLSAVPEQPQDSPGSTGTSALTEQQIRDQIASLTRQLERR